MKKEVVLYLKRIGAKGGRKSRRTLDSGKAREMARVRDARRAYKRFQTECFWSYDPDYKVTPHDLAWVIDGLKKHGGREAWNCAVRLCR
jgi:hypothetical protein